jgi:RNA polymerase sigma-70 factor (ECF subfamily)
LDKPEELYERFVQPVEGQMIRSVWQVLRDPDDAEDALQDSLAVILKRLKRISRHPNPRALILRICLDVAHDRLRRKLRRERRESTSPVSVQIPDPAPGPAARVAGQEKQSEVLRAIGHLSRNQGTAFLMRVVHEQSYQDIAQALGCGEQTARTHVARARNALRRLLPGLAPTSE